MQYIFIQILIFLSSEMRVGADGCVLQVWEFDLNSGFCHLTGCVVVTKSCIKKLKVAHIFIDFFFYKSCTLCRKCNFQAQFLH